MSTNMPPYMSSVQTQLASIMDVLARAAVAEISQLFSESSADLRLEVSRSIKENEMLRMRMKVMKSELFALRIQRANTPRVGRFSLSRALCRPRSKLAVIDRTDRRGSSEVDCSITTTEERSNITPTVQIESAEVENNCPDVILIKDEEGPDNYFGEHQLHSDQDHTPDADEGAESVAMATPELDPASVMLHHGGPCIVSIHGGEEEEGVRDPEQPDPQDPSPFTDPPDLQGFPTLTCSLPGSHGSQTSLGPRAAGRPVVGRAQGGGEAHGRGGSLDIVQATTTLATSAAMNPTAPNLARYGGWRLGQDLIQPQPQPQSQSQRSPPPHSHTPLVCSFCDKRFYRRSDLARHRALHTGETPTTCALCGKQFVNKTTLNVHMRIHTGEKPYTCTLCGKSFTQNGSLTIHLRTHSGEKPYSCTLCGASFNNPSNLRRHMVTHQDGPAPDSLTSQGLR